MRATATPAAHSTALPVVVGVVPCSDQRTANRWHRCCMLAALGVCFLLTFVIGLFG